MRSKPEIHRQSQLEDVAASALAFLAEDSDRLWRFLDLSGLQPDGLRSAASNPLFLRALIEHIVSDDALLQSFATHQQIEPADMARQCARLLPHDAASDDDPNDTWQDP